MGKNIKQVKKSFEIRLQKFGRGEFPRKYIHILAKNKTEARKLVSKKGGWTIFCIREDKWNDNYSAR